MGNSCRIFADGFDGEGFRREFDQVLASGIKRLKGHKEDDAGFRAAYERLEENLAGVLDRWKPPREIAQGAMRKAGSQVIEEVLAPLGIDCTSDGQVVRRTCISIMKATEGFGSGTPRLDRLETDTVRHLETAGLERSEAQRLIRSMARLETTDIRDVMDGMDLRHVDFLRFVAKNGTPPQLKESASEALDRILSVKSTATILPFRRERQMVLLRPLIR